jgi:dTMP kinase
VQQGLKPDLTLLLDLPIETGLDRAEQRSEPDRFEVEQHAFFERVRSTYLDIAQRDSQRVRVIDAAVPLAQVQAQIRLIMERFVQEQCHG